MQKKTNTHMSATLGDVQKGMVTEEKGQSDEQRRKTPVSRQIADATDDIDGMFFLLGNGATRISKILNALQALTQTMETLREQSGTPVSDQERRESRIIDTTNAIVDEIQRFNTAIYDLGDVLFKDVKELKTLLALHKCDVEKIVKESQM